MLFIVIVGTLALSLGNIRRLSLAGATEVNCDFPEGHLCHFLARLKTKSLQMFFFHEITAIIVTLAATFTPPLRVFIHLAIFLCLAGNIVFWKIVELAVVSCCYLFMIRCIVKIANDFSFDAHSNIILLVATWLPVMNKSCRSFGK